jgi:hypothetical protein
MVGDRLESTIGVASTMWTRARVAVQKTAGSAVTLVQSNLPNVKLPAMFVTSPAKPAKKRAAKRTAAAKPVKRVRRKTSARGRTTK